MVVAAHLIDSDREMSYMIIEFNRSMNPHTGVEAWTFPIGAIKEWGIVNCIQYFTTHNSSDMVSGMEKRRKGLRLENCSVVQTEIQLSLEKFHVRFIAHVFNIIVKHCMPIFYFSMENIRTLLNAIRKSVKRRDLLQKFKLDLGLDSQLPLLAVDKRWSATFKMIEGMYQSRSVIYATLKWSSLVEWHVHHGCYTGEI